MHIIVILALTHMIRIIDLVIICVETLKRGIECFLKKSFIKLIYMNPYIVLYLTINQVDSCHNYINDP